MEIPEPTVIMRPVVFPEEIAARVEQHEARQVRSERLAEIERLMRHHDCLSLDYYLEERAAYRELISRCQHRGVPLPRKPKYYDVGKREETVSRAPAYRPTRKVTRYFGDVDIRVY